MKSVPDVQIVIISSWRYPCKFDPKMIEYLLLTHGVDCHGRVVGCTIPDEHVMDGPAPDFENYGAWSDAGIVWRKKQIELYIAENHLDPDFCVVLDDLPIDVANLIRTHPRQGVTFEQAQEAIDILSGVANQR